MRNDNQRMTVRQLAEAVLPHIKEKHYGDSYTRSFRQIFNMFALYCEERGIIHFSTEVSQQFLQERYGLLPGTTCRRYSRQTRAMDMLADFHQTGAVAIRRRKERKFPSQLADYAEAYLAHMETEYARPNTVSSHRQSLYRFADFMDSRGASSYVDISSEDIIAYNKMLVCNYSKSSTVSILSIIRRFLKYLHKSNATAEDLSTKLLSANAPSYKQHLPSTFQRGQIDAMLSCVDRGSPMGKRDYAVLLLAYKLGLRTSDIRNLKPSDIEWEKLEIRITQFKTGVPLSLPLPLDVGWAVIDYMRNGRPPSDSPEIFLRATAPYIPLENFDNILVRYMNRAKIPYERMRHHGLHTLRHSLATHMLEEGIPITSIQGVLGHVRIETTQEYTGISVRQLKECVLEVPET